MKKFAYIAIAALALASCAKEVEAPIAPQKVNTYTVTITASLDATKTAYDQEGKFSWVEGDKIGVLAEGEEGIKQFQLTAQSSGVSVQFTGEVEEGYTLTGMASYPFTQVSEGYVCNDLAWDKQEGDESAVEGWRLWGSIKPSLENPLASIPLIGLMDGEDSYAFHTATGIVKFTVENVPVNTAYAYLQVPEDTKEQYNLNGWYVLDEEDDALHMTTAIEPWDNRYNWNAPTDYNQTIDYYFFIPVGTLPAGTMFALCNASFEAIGTYEFKKDIEVPRNQVVNFKSIKLEPVKVYTMDEVLGTYEMEFTAGPYSGGNAPEGEIVLAESDDATKGNIMLTKFAGVEGKQYGIFDGVTIVFDKDQLFAENPYGDAETWPYIALDFYTGTVVDPAFEVTGVGQITALADVTGFRATTEDKWYNDNHNGSWPWKVSYSSLTAHWPYPADWQSIGTGSFRDNFVWPFAELTDYVQVEFQQDKNHPTLFRLAKPYPGDNSDEWFVINIKDPTKVASENYFVDIEVTAEGKATFKPWVRNGIDYGYNYSDVLKWQADGVTPANIEIAPCYRGEGFDGTAEGYAYEIGKDHEELAIEINFPGCAPYDPNAYVRGEEIKLKQSMITASNVCSHDGGGVPALIDNDATTFWHSDWYYPVTNNDPVYGIYFDIELASAIDAAQFKYQVRSGNSGSRPTKVVWGVSADGETWKQIDVQETDEMNEAAAGAWITLPAKALGGEYKYLRFGIAKSAAGDLTGDLNMEYPANTNLAELKLIYAEVPEEVEITIDGVFDDWANVEGADLDDEGKATHLKAFCDGTNMFLYLKFTKPATAEFDLVTSWRYFRAYFDTDNDLTTGFDTSNWLYGGADNLASDTNILVWIAKDGSVDYAAVDGVADQAVKVVVGDGVIEAEVRFPLSLLGTGLASQIKVFTDASLGIHCYGKLSGVAIPATL